jgi:hypothetical protein
MNSQQRQQIRGLIKHYSGSGTESFIAYVAETNGMLAACQALLQSLEEADPISSEWLLRECSEKNVVFHAFLQEVQQTVTLFRPNHQNEDHHATLGVAANAGPEEIKHAYRILSRRYHPDTASPPYRDNPETFIAINKAYQALTKNDDTGAFDEYINQGKQWRSKKVRSVSPEQRKKVVVWTLGLLLVLAVVSTFASMNYKKRAMLAGLQQSRGAFIPPTRNMPTDSGERVKKGGNQPFDRPLKSSQTITETSQAVVVQTQTEPELVPATDRVAERPQSRNEQVITKNTLAAVSPDGVRKAKESKQVPSTEPRGAAGLSTEVDGRSSGQQPGIIAVAKKNGNASIPAGSREKAPSVAAVAATGATGHPNRLVDAPTPRQENHADPSPAEILNTIIPAATSHSSAGKTGQEIELANATVARVVSPPDTSFHADEQGHNETHLQTRVDRFFADYINAYEQRNPILFARFFAAEAEENGKPFTTMLPTYLDLFATTRRISFQVEGRKLQPGDNGLVAIDGQFKVYLEYSDGRKLSGSGPIQFRLTANGNELLVKEMKYVFNTE